MAKATNEPALLVTDYHKSSFSSNRDDYRYACLVYKTTASDWELHLFNPGRKQHCTTVETPFAAPDTWLVTMPIDLSEHGNNLISRYNNGLHGTFAFSTDNQDSIFYIKELVFFVTYEQAILWSAEYNDVSSFAYPPIVISMQSEADTLKNGIIYQHLPDPSQTGSWYYDDKEQALAITYTEKDFILNHQAVGHYRVAPRFSQKNMLYIHPGHRHARGEINVVLDGEMEVICGADVFCLKPGELILIPPHAFHRNHSSSDLQTEIVTVHFNSPCNADMIPTTLTMNDRQKDLFRLLCCDIEDGLEPTHHDKLVNISENAQKLFEVFNNYVTTRQVAIKMRADKDAMVYNTAVEYMNTNIDKQLKVSEIAKTCAICQTKLKNIFTKYTGAGIIEFFIGLKLERARELLLSGKACAEISEELGFSSPAYFSKRFKLQYGISPSKIKATKNRYR